MMMHIQLCDNSDNQGDVLELERNDGCEIVTVSVRDSDSCGSVNINLNDLKKAIDKLAL